MHIGIYKSKTSYYESIKYTFYYVLAHYDFYSAQNIMFSYFIFKYV